MCTQVQWEEQVLAGGIFGLQTNFQSSISARFLSLLKKDGGPTFLGSGKIVSSSLSLCLPPSHSFLLYQRLSELICYHQKTTLSYVFPLHLGRWVECTDTYIPKLAPFYQHSRTHTSRPVNRRWPVAPRKTPRPNP